MFLALRFGTLVHKQVLRMKLNGMKPGFLELDARMEVRVMVGAKEIVHE